MEEIRKEIEGYEGLYEITRSGRVYSIYSKKFMTRCDDEYGFHVVTLYKHGKKKNHNVFKLWKIAFENEPESEFKGALKVKYK
jgi:hypothetical protein